MRSNSVTGFAGVFSTGSPRVRMGRITVARFRSWLVVGSQVRLGLDAGHDVPRGQLTDRAAERRDPAGVEREQAYRLLPQRRDEQRRRLEPVQLGLELRSRRPPGRPPCRPGTPPRRRRRASSPWNRRGFPCTRACTAGSFAWEACTIARPPGRAQAIASIQVVTARSRAARPGRLPGEVRVEHGHQIEAARPQVADVVGTTDEISPSAGSRGASSGPSRATEAETTPAAHSSTRSRPPRRTPKVVPPQFRQRPGASQTTHRILPSSDAQQPTARRARGRLDRTSGRPPRSRIRAAASR